MDLTPPASPPVVFGCVEYRDWLGGWVFDIKIFSNVFRGSNTDTGCFNLSGTHSASIPHGWPIAMWCGSRVAVGRAEHSRLYARPTITHAPIYTYVVIIKYPSWWGGWLCCLKDEIDMLLTRAYVAVDLEHASQAAGHRAPNVAQGRLIKPCPRATYGGCLATRPNLPTQHAYLGGSRDPSAPRYP